MNGALMVERTSVRSCLIYPDQEDGGSNPGEGKNFQHSNVQLSALSERALVSYKRRTFLHF